MIQQYDIPLFRGTSLPIVSYLLECRNNYNKAYMWRFIKLFFWLFTFVRTIKNLFRLKCFCTWRNLAPVCRKRLFISFFRLTVETITNKRSLRKDRILHLIDWPLICTDVTLYILNALCIWEFEITYSLRNLLNRLEQFNVYIIIVT